MTIPPVRPRPYWLWLTLAVSAFCTLVYGAAPYIMPGAEPAAWMPAWIALSNLICLSLCFAVYGVVRLTDRMPAAWAWPAAFIAAAAAAIISAFSGYELVIWYERDNPAFKIDYLRGMGMNVIIDVWMFGFFAAAQKLLRNLELERAKDARLAEARLASGRAQLRALRYQISPHFLFNTLNAISGLIVVGRNAEATAMMRQLSDYLRSSTDTEVQSLCSLADELATVQAYLAIERVRFGRRLAFSIDCAHDLRDAEVPSFLIQPLVENAVKHAVAPSSDRVTIRLGAALENGKLVITLDDDGKVRKKVARGMGIGLRNIAERLALLHGTRAALETDLRDDGFTARISMPLQRTAPKFVAANDPDDALTHYAAAGI